MQNHEQFFQELPVVICLLGLKEEARRRVWTGQREEEEKESKEKREREKQLADVKEDHTAQDTITRYLHRPLPLIY